MMFQLYERFAHLYDLHTPPHHYQHDHKFVLDLVAPLGKPPSLLDVGCGTGVLLRKALDRGYNVLGLDSAARMVKISRDKLGTDRVMHCQMQDLDEDSCWDAVTALSWVINYCSEDEFPSVLARFYKAIRPGGLFIAQIAHAKSATGEWYQDCEFGPTGIPDDLLFRYRFNSVVGNSTQLKAHYSCICHSTAESFEEVHYLYMADAYEVACYATNVGFVNVQLFNSWQADPFMGVMNPWIVAQCPEIE